MYSKTRFGPSRVEFVLPFPYTLMVKMCFKDLYRVFSWCIGSQGNNHCSFFLFVGGSVALWLVRSTLERAVWVRAVAGDIVLCS